MYPMHALFLGSVFVEGVISVNGRHVLILVNGAEPDICHANLLPLIDERRPLLEQVTGRQHRTRFAPVFLAPVPADHSRMVVVFQIQGVPPLPAQGKLPLGKSPLELRQGEGQMDVLCHEAVRHHGVELDHHIEYPVLPRQIPEGGLHRGHRRFPNLHSPIFESDFPEFPQVSHKIRAVLVIRKSVDDGQKRDAVRQAGGFGDKGDDVFPESVHAKIQPEFQDLFYFLADFGISHVQIRLFFSKNMQIILVQALVILPGAAFEQARPVVGRYPFSVDDLALAPVIVIMIGIVIAFFAFDEPLVFVGSMVDDQVHKDFHASFVSTVQDFLKDAKIAEIRMDIHVIGDVVSIVGVGRRINGREPDGVGAKALDIVKLAEHAPQIADPVAVSVAETAAPDLVYDHGLVPVVTVHWEDPPVK